MTHLDDYKTHYQLNAIDYQTPTELVFIDLNKEIHFDKTKNTYIYDLDHTLLNSTRLKEELLSAFANAYPSITHELWTETYKKAKVHEALYDYHLHLKLLSLALAQKEDPTVISKLENILMQTVHDSVPHLMYSNLLEEINTRAEDANLILVSSGSTSFQRLKVSAALTTLQKKPCMIVYNEGGYKGQAIEKVSEVVMLEESPHIFVYDDNPDELTDIKKNLPQGPKVDIIRVKQEGGLYNDKE